MKKQLCILTAAAALFASSCSSAAPASSADSTPTPALESGADSQTETAVVGGWQLMEDETITDELEAVFDQAAEGLTGASYTPYLCLAKQIVSGTNYAVFCLSETVTSTPVKDYAIVYIYEDLNGNSKILDVVPLEYAGAPDTLGKWEVAESPEIDEELSQVFASAMEGFTGVGLTPCIYLGHQLVNGTNHDLLCRKSTVAVEGDASWAVVTIHEDLDGKAEIIDIQELEIRLPE